MALSFPSSPSVDQIYSDDTNSWRWNGTTWKKYNPISFPAGTISIVNGGSATSTDTIIQTENSTLDSAPSSAGIAVSTGSGWGTSLAIPAGDLVGTTATQTLTNKTLTSPTVNSPVISNGSTTGTFSLGGALDETVYAVVDAAGVALSPSNGTIQTWTLGASRTPTAGTWNAGESMTLMILDGTAYTITWTTIGVTWVGGSAPTLDTTKYTIIEFWKVGSTIYGALVGYA